MKDRLVPGTVPNSVWCLFQGWKPLRKGLNSSLVPTVFRNVCQMCKCQRRPPLWTTTMTRDSEEVVWCQGYGDAGSPGTHSFPKRCVKFQMCIECSFHRLTVAVGILTGGQEGDPLEMLIFNLTIHHLWTGISEVPGGSIGSIHRRWVH
jgi:hypothetical protein